MTVRMAFTVPLDAEVFLLFKSGGKKNKVRFTTSRIRVLKLKKKKLEEHSAQNRSSSYIFKTVSNEPSNPCRVIHTQATCFKKKLVNLL